MPIPNLIHPVPITFELLDRDETVFDKYAREPVGQAIRQGESPRTGSQVTVKGQYSEYFASARHDYPTYEREGVEETTDSYVSLRYKDLLHAGLVELNNGVWENMQIKRGDRVVQIGREQVNLYVQGFKLFAHYPGPKGTMIQVNLADRHPVDQQGNL
jgi:hypothetical protein